MNLTRNDTITTLVTRLGLFRTFQEWRLSEIMDAHTNAQRVARFLLQETDEHADQLVMDSWLYHEHALLGYGAAAAHRLWKFNIKGIDPTWWSSRQEDFRRSFPNHINTRPAWVSNPEVIYSHRARLVRQSRIRYQYSWAKVWFDSPILWPKMDRAAGTYELYVSEFEARDHRIKLPPHLQMDKETRKVTVKCASE